MQHMIEDHPWSNSAGLLPLVGERKLSESLLALRSNPEGGRIPPAQPQGGSNSVDAGGGRIPLDHPGSNSATCRECLGTVPAEAKRCSHCGMTLRDRSLDAKAVAIIAVLALVIVIGLAMSAAGLL